jgi:hypothetical protein
MRARLSGTGPAGTATVPSATGPSASFAAVAARLREAVPRGEVTLEEVPAPTRLAPHAVAFAAEVSHGEVEVASGRLVVLHDPDGQEGWAGDTRLVTLVQAPVEREMAGDPLLGEVAWGWLAEALASRGATTHAAGGTVTRTTSTRHGDLAPSPSPSPSSDDTSRTPAVAEEAEVELRASWSPGASGDRSGLEEDLVTHLAAWCDLLCAVAGLPPPGVAALPRQD